MWGLVGVSTCLPIGWPQGRSLTHLMDQKPRRRRRPGLLARALA